jgi:tagatose 1,6-diphosphate aldolase
VTATFRFLKPPELVDHELTLLLEECTERDASRERVATYHFGMYAHGIRVGGLRFRAQDEFDVTTYAGNIGYNVDEAHRGRHYAERACRLLAPFARQHGYQSLWITCNPANPASRRTIERLGGQLVDIRPATSPGTEPKCRYRWLLEPSCNSRNATDRIS